MCTTLIIREKIKNKRYFALAPPKVHDPDTNRIKVADY